MITIVLPEWFIYLVAVLIAFYILDVVLKVVLAVLNIQSKKLDKEIRALAKHIGESKKESKNEQG